VLLDEIGGHQLGAFAVAVGDQDATLSAKIER
jgi:hypothetical protein